MLIIIVGNEHINLIHVHTGLITFREADVISVLSEGLDPVSVQHWSYFSRFCGLCKTQMLHSTTQKLPSVN